MIHLISPENCHLYGEEIKGIHRARKAVFVDELSWNLPVLDGMEFDEYDDERASNVVGFSSDGEVVMGLRFRPADDRSMLVDHFAHVLPADIRPINDGKTWELSRGFSVERGVRRHNLRRKAACMIAPLEIALNAGVDRCVGFTDVRMLSFCYGVGWKLKLLGPAVPYDEGDAVAYELEVSETALEKMRKMWGLPQPSFIEIHELRPGENSVHDAANRIMCTRPDLKKLASQPEAAPTPIAEAPSKRPAEYYGSFSTLDNSPVRRVS